MNNVISQLGVETMTSSYNISALHKQRLRKYKGERSGWRQPCRKGSGQESVLPQQPGGQSPSRGAPDMAQ